MSTEIDKVLKEAMELCKKERIVGTNTHIDGYYVSFSFKKLKERCKECGHIIE